MFLRSFGLLSLLPKGLGLGFAITDGRLRGAGVYLIDPGYKVFVRSEGVLDGEIVGIVPVKGAFGLIVTVSSATSTVREHLLDIRHSGIGGVVL